MKLFSLDFYNSILENNKVLGQIKTFDICSKMDETHQQYVWIDFEVFKFG